MGQIAINLLESTAYNWFKYRAILSNGLGYRVSCSLTPNLPIMLLKLDRL